jgi:hypothetical protein
MITKLDEWETNQNKKAENISLLINFLDWISLEEEKLEKEREEVREQKAKELFLGLLGLRLEQERREKEEFLKSIHPDFTPEFKEQ